jgi:hypothetical protein
MFNNRNNVPEVPRPVPQRPITAEDLERCALTAMRFGQTSLEQYLTFYHHTHGIFPPIMEPNPNNPEFLEYSSHYEHGFWREYMIRLLRNGANPDSVHHWQTQIRQSAGLIMRRNPDFWPSYVYRSSQQDVINEYENDLAKRLAVTRPVSRVLDLADEHPFIINLYCEFEREAYMRPVWASDVETAFLEATSCFLNEVGQESFDDWGINPSQLRQLRSTF